ncbi:hypothetical protein NUACC26_059620 [Scytonema sp. NUACC26]
MLKDRQLKACDSASYILKSIILVIDLAYFETSIFTDIQMENITLGFFLQVNYLIVA